MECTGWPAPHLWPHPVFLSAAHHITHRERQFHGCQDTWQRRCSQQPFSQASLLGSCSYKNDSHEEHTKTDAVEKIHSQGGSRKVCCKLRLPQQQQRQDLLTLWGTSGPASIRQESNPPRTEWEPSCAAWQAPLSLGISAKQADGHPQMRFLGAARHPRKMASLFHTEETGIALEASIRSPDVKQRTYHYGLWIARCAEGRSAVRPGFLRVSLPAQYITTSPSVVSGRKPTILYVELCTVVVCQKSPAPRPLEACMHSSQPVFYELLET